MSGCSRPKTPLDLTCLDGMSMPIRRTPITPEYRRTTKVRNAQHAWHVRRYVPHPRQEPECDPDLIEARIQAVLQAKRAKWTLFRTTTSLSDEQAAQLRLPGDDQP